MAWGQIGSPLDRAGASLAGLAGGSAGRVAQGAGPGDPRPTRAGRSETGPGARAIGPDRH